MRWLTGPVNAARGQTTAPSGSRSAVEATARFNDLRVADEPSLLHQLGHVIS
jgi:hypothetical protein